MMGQCMCFQTHFQTLLHVQHVSLQTHDTSSTEMVGGENSPSEGRERSFPVKQALMLNTVCYGAHL